MNQIYLPKFDIDITLLGGQSFCWDKNKDGSYTGFMTDKIIKVRYENNHLIWQTYPKKNDYEFIKKYFRLNENYDNILERIEFDDHVKSAREHFPHIRILKQDFEKTFFQFIISQNCNIKSIRYRVRKLAEKFGDKIELNGKTYHLFPTAEQLSKTSLDDLLSCSLGYRAKFVKASAEQLIESGLTERIENMNLDEARAELKNFMGIGDKVADCILLYGLSFDNIFPMDLWGQRVLVHFYDIDPKWSYEQMRNWIDNRFDGLAGWAGQFLFEYARLNGIK